MTLEPVSADAGIHSCPAPACHHRGDGGRQKPRGDCASCPGEPADRTRDRRRGDDPGSSARRRGPRLAAGLWRAPTRTSRAGPSGWSGRGPGISSMSACAWKRSGTLILDGHAGVSPEMAIRREGAGGSSAEFRQRHQTTCDLVHARGRGDQIDIQPHWGQPITRDRALISPLVPEEAPFPEEWGCLLPRIRQRVWQAMPHRRPPSARHGATGVTIACWQLRSYPSSACCLPWIPNAGKGMQVSRSGEP